MFKTEKDIVDMGGTASDTHLGRRRRRMKDHPLRN